MGSKHSRHHQNKHEPIATAAPPPQQPPQQPQQQLQPTMSAEAVSPPPENTREISMHDLHNEQWSGELLTVVVAGGSGDLAKKKTYPALFSLFSEGLLPGDTLVMGYARSPMKDADFRQKMEPFLLGKNPSDEKRKKVATFLGMCLYRSGQYESAEDVAKMMVDVEAYHASNSPKAKVENRIFYLALPPSQFVPVAASFKKAAVSKTGYSRIVVEKPFGVDTESARSLGKELGALWPEESVYRIDHYLGKEMVQNLIVLRFANSMFEPLWNRTYVSAVQVSFKEDFGTMGRGGYFDSVGIIRDVIQNHLIQVLSLVAMEPPVRVSGGDYANFVRDEKVKVLKAIRPIRFEDVVIGQYTANPEKGEPGYLEDATVPAGSTCATFATIVMYIDNARWQGVPFIVKAGKGLDNRRSEVRIQFKPPPAASLMFGGALTPQNELVLRLQPNEAVYAKVNVKRPGLHTQPLQSELDLQYSTRYPIVSLADAYVRLILDVVRGKQATFVRDDELLASWEIFTPLLKQLEGPNKVKPIPYVFGSRGPKESDELIKRVGFVWSEDYANEWKASKGQQHL